MKVLIAIDEQASINEMSRFVTQHKWADDTEFLVLNVVAPIMFDYYPMASYPLFLESVQKDAETAGQRIVTEAKMGLKALGAKTDTEIKVGLPVQVVVDTAKDWRADLVVVGCHGRSGFNKFLLGSVSQEIATQAPCTVIILRLEPIKEKVMQPEFAKPKMKIAAAT